jgi:nucleotide-binding universal stress UspA family protein
LQLGVEEARLRGAPLLVMTAWRSRFTDIHDVRAASEGNRRVGTHLDHSLACWRRRCRDLDLRSVAVHGSAVNYLAKYAADIQLVVVGSDDRSDVGDLLAPTGSAALHDTDCSLTYLRSASTVVSVHDERSNIVLSGTDHTHGSSEGSQWSRSS